MQIVHQPTETHMKELTVKLTSTAPLLMHADHFANPLNDLTKAHKELTAKRKKTDEDHLAIARSEFIGGCYWKDRVGFYIPGQNFQSCLVAAAKLQKLGVKFKQGVGVVNDELVLDGFEKVTPEMLWEKQNEHVDVRGVKVGMAKVMRYRPLFQKWSATAQIWINEDVVSLSDVKKAITDAGALIGLCDNRPRYGRFAAALV